MNFKPLTALFVLIFLCGCVSESGMMVHNISKATYSQNETESMGISNETYSISKPENGSQNISYILNETQEENNTCEIRCGPCEYIENCTCITLYPCNGNGICEEGEYGFSDDCPDCNDNNPCTQDGYDYKEKRCINEPIVPCCGNNICEDGESQSCQDCSQQSKPPRIVYVNYDAPGDDRRKENWNGEWVEIEGYGIDMTGWSLSDDGGHTYHFPDGFLLKGRVYIHSGDGENNETDLYWNGGRRPIWNNDGDTAILKDENGDVIDIYSY